jgi:glyoxylase-like metal-dependent hydrolase (beta-lactamase superfamily II)
LPGIWWVARNAWGGHKPLTDTGGNVYLIRGTNFDVMVDVGQRSMRQLERNIRLAGSEPSRVGEIWITHSHGDHFALAGPWQRKYPHVKVRLADVGRAFLRRGDLRLVGAALTPGEKFQRPQRLLGVREGQVLRCPPHEFCVVGLPGHTPDCIGFRGTVAGLDVMFTGDAIIGDQGPVRGNVGWLDGLWLSDAFEYRRMLRAMVKNPPQVFLPGHGVSHAGPGARRSLRNCLWRIDRLLAIPHLGSMLPVVGKDEDQ